jgi:hypothetical protein
VIEALSAKWARDVRESELRVPLACGNFIVEMPDWRRGYVNSVIVAIMS